MPRPAGLRGKSGDRLEGARLPKVSIHPGSPIGYRAESLEWGKEGEKGKT